MKGYREYFAESGVEVHSPDTNHTTQKESGNVDILHALSECKSLAELRYLVDTACGCELKSLAKNTVFGDGNPSSDIMFIGEAPGANEDDTGIPFCGQSGKLLDNIIASLGYKRPEVYITNAVFWRPPGNRRPTQQEIAVCKPFVEKHIAIVKPKVIILVGSTAAESLLDSDKSMHELRQNFYQYHNRYTSEPIQVGVIFHPSYLLRQQLKKSLMWEDVCKIQKYISVPLKH